MKNLSVFLLISVFPIVFLSSCTKKCEDFDNRIIDWMPYKKSDKIIISQNGEKDTLTVNYSEIHHTDKIGFGVKCACVNSFILELSSNSLNIDVMFNDSKQVELSDIVINDEWLSYSEQADTIILNGHVFTDVIIYKNTNVSSSARFDKILISKSIGIVAIVGKDDEWIIIDNSIKDIEISAIEFQSTDC